MEKTNIESSEYISERGEVLENLKNDIQVFLEISLQGDVVEAKKEKKTNITF